MFETIRNEEAVSSQHVGADESSNFHGDVEAFATDESPTRLRNDSTDFQKMVVDLLKETLARINVLEKSQIDMIVERRLSDDAAEASTIGNLDTLAAFGLPAKAKDDLDKLELQLATPDANNSLVSITNC